MQGGQAWVKPIETYLTNKILHFPAEFEENYYKKMQQNIPIWYSRH